MLTEYCDYGTLEDRMIRDWIVVGLQYSKLLEKLQLDPELALPKAINQAQKSETIKKQQTFLRNNFKDSTETKKVVDAVKVKGRNAPKYNNGNWPKSTTILSKKLLSHQLAANAVGNPWTTHEPTALLKHNLSQVLEERSLGSCLQIFQDSEWSGTRLCVPWWNWT